MISLDEALEHVLKATHPLDVIPVGLDDALGHCLLMDPYSHRDVPGFRNSAMDGYAVKTQDIKVDEWLKVAAIQAAEDSPLGDVQAGSCVRVMTGSAIPQWADAVIAREDVDETSNFQIKILARPRIGSNIRAAGEDVVKGSFLKLSGRPLSPGDLGVLASIGKSTLSVHRQPRVSLICTGSELLEPQDSPRIGAVVNTNRHTLSASLNIDGCRMVRKRVVPDSPELIHAALMDSRDCDVIITTGGVSMGDFDHVKQLIPDMGMKVLFQTVAIKPGKPLMVALWDRSIVFALPGNPVSALVTYELFVRPALRKMRGDLRSHSSPVLAGEDLPGVAGKTHVLRVRTCTQINRQNLMPEVRLTGPQGSGVLSSFSKADGLVCLSKTHLKGQILSMSWIAGRGPWL